MAIEAKYIIKTNNIAPYYDYRHINPWQQKKKKLRKIHAEMSEVRWID